MASPRPLPTNLKVLRGTAQPCRMNDREPVPARRKVKMPTGLTASEKKHWRTVAGDLEKAGILTVLDTQALRLYCRSYTGWLDANAKIDEYGPIIKSMHGPALSPYFRLSDKYFHQMLAILREFGMTPSSRSRIRSENEQSDEDDFEAWNRKQKEKRRRAREGV